jgi:hypothetical protein
MLQYSIATSSVIEAATPCYLDELSGINNGKKAHGI